jgi:RNA polymerase-binding transcription factor
MSASLKVRKSTYRTLLLKKREELLARARSGPEALSVSVQSPDDMEFAVQTVEQDVNVTTASVRSRMLKQIDYALERVAGGTYGECQACGEQISPNRLKAVPWAECCLTCEEMRSRN